VANILRETAGGDNTVLGRVGGEEFALLLTDISKVDALAFAENLRLNIGERPVEWRGATATVTLSVGFDATPSWQGDVSPLLARADGALYAAKRKGPQSHRGGAGVSGSGGLSARASLTRAPSIEHPEPQHLTAPSRYFSELPTSVKTALTFVPTTWTAAMINIATKLAISAYSIAVTPS
jgi:hypothetical protein